MIYESKSRSTEYQSVDGMDWYVAVDVYIFLTTFFDEIYHDFGSNGTSFGAWNTNFLPVEPAYIWKHFLL